MQRCSPGHLCDTVGGKIISLARREHLDDDKMVPRTHGQGPGTDGRIDSKDGPAHRGPGRPPPLLKLKSQIRRDAPEKALHQAAEQKRSRRPGGHQRLGALFRDRVGSARDADLGQEDLGNQEADQALPAPGAQPGQPRLSHPRHGVRYTKRGKIHPDQHPRREKHGAGRRQAGHHGALPADRPAQRHSPLRYAGTALARDERSGRRLPPGDQRRHRGQRPRLHQSRALRCRIYDAALPGAAQEPLQARSTA